MHQQSPFGRQVKRSPQSGQIAVRMVCAEDGLASIGA
jgi:hypothetical protein